jgi:hypothetical protein
MFMALTNDISRMTHMFRTDAMDENWGIPGSAAKPTVIFSDMPAQRLHAN